MEDAPKEFYVPVEKMAIVDGLGYETMWAVENSITEWQALNAETDYPGFPVEVGMKTDASSKVYRRGIIILSYKLMGRSRDPDSVRPVPPPPPNDACRYIMQVVFEGKRYKIALYLPDHNCHIHFS